MVKQLQCFIIVCLLLAVLTTSVHAFTAAEKPVHKIEVRELIISPLDRACKSSITATVNVHNRGNMPEAVFVELVNKELGVSAFSPNVVIAEGRSQGIGIPFQIEETTKGSYEFEVRLYTNQDIKRLLQTVHFEGCPKAKVTSLIKPAQQNIHSNGYITNEINEESAPLSTRTWFTIGMIFVLVLLAITFIIKAFWLETARK